MEASFIVHLGCSCDDDRAFEFVYGCSEKERIISLKQVTQTLICTWNDRELFLLARAQNPTTLTLMSSTGLKITFEDTTGTFHEVTSIAAILEFLGKENKYLHEIKRKFKEENALLKTKIELMKRNAMGVMSAPVFPPQCPKCGHGGVAIKRPDNYSV